MAQLVKNLPAMWEAMVRCRGWEDSLEKGTAPTPVFWHEGFHSPWGRKKSDRTEQLLLSLSEGEMPKYQTKTNRMPRLVSNSTD